MCIRDRGVCTCAFCCSNCLCKVSDIVYCIKYPEYVYAVLRRLCHKFIYHIVGIMAVSHKILTTQQHLKRGFWQVFFKLNKAFPRVFIEISDTGIKRRAAPYFQREKAHVIKLFADWQHVPSPHAGGNQGLVCIPKNSLGKLYLTHWHSSLIVSLMNPHRTWSLLICRLVYSRMILKELDFKINNMVWGTAHTHQQELCFMAPRGQASTQRQHSIHSATLGAVALSFTSSKTSAGQILAHSPAPPHKSSSISIVISPDSYFLTTIFQPPFCTLFLIYVYQPCVQVFAATIIHWHNVVRVY